MKNFLKKGFSLAELLLCITIIGIVSAMGMTIAKHGSDKAYNLFYYSGYINLYNALADAIANNPNGTTVNYLQSVYTTLNSNNNAIGAINRNNNNYSNASLWPNVNNRCITTNNGIRYYYRTTTGRNYITFLMTVPQRKTRTNNGVSTVRLLFLNEGQGYLIPMASINVNMVNLFDRRDLLPAYIDNGKIGRNNAFNRNANFQYEPIRYTSYKNAFCTLHNNGLGVVTCNGYTPATPSSGVLKVANPQKAR